MTQQNDVKIIAEQAMKSYCISILLALATIGAAQTQYSVTIREPVAQKDSWGYGINDSGAMVGQTRYPTDGSQRRAFIYIGERLRILDPLAPSVSNIVDGAYGVNNGWDLAGFSRNTSGKQRPIMWRRAKQVIDLGVLPGTQEGAALAINDHQQIVGHCYSGNMLAFHYYNGVMSELPPLDWGMPREARDINNNGLIVGYSNHRAVFWDSAHNVFAVPMQSGWFGSRSTAINDEGDIVGHGSDDVSQEDTPSARQAFLYADGIVTILPPIGNHGYWAEAINSQGTIVGGYTSLEFSTQGAFVYKDGITSDLAPMVMNMPAGWTIRGVSAISDAGEISGIVRDEVGGRYHAVVFKPLP